MKVQETEIDLYNKVRHACRDNALNSFGYRYIFDNKIKNISSLINGLKLMGIIVPATFGAIGIAYGLDASIVKYALAMAIPATVIQFVISVIAINYKWDDELLYAFEASQSYGGLDVKFTKLAEFPPLTYSEILKEFDLINTEYNFRQQQDSKHIISEWQLRKGMRYALRERKRNCYGCKAIPLSMDSTPCPVCGNFSFIYQYKILALCRPRKN